MIEITEDILRRIYPESTSKNRAKYVHYFNEYLSDYDITTRLRLCSYFAQIGHESGQLKYSEEIASGVAYEGRKDLGNINTGDGIKFKGRGLIQLTGRSNYQFISKTYNVDFVNYPELLSTPEWAVKSSLWFWERNNLNSIADSGDFKKITKRINGGLNGYDDRLRLYELCEKTFSDIIA